MAGPDEFDLRSFHSPLRTWLARLYAGLQGPVREPTYVLTRFVLLRVLGLVCLAACLSAVFQLAPLVGASGVTPAARELAAHPGGAWSGFLELPTLFWWD